MCVCVCVCVCKLHIESIFKKLRILKKNYWNFFKTDSRLLKIFSSIFYWDANANFILKFKWLDF